MFAWLKSLWTDEARFAASVVWVLGTIGTTVPTLASMQLEDFRIPGTVVALAAVCNVIALRFGYVSTPGGK